MVHPNVLGFEEAFGLVFMDKELLLAALDHTHLENKKRSLLLVTSYWILSCMIT